MPTSLALTVTSYPAGKQTDIEILGMELDVKNKELLWPRKGALH